MNKLDLDYQNLLKDILENGTKKETRNGGTISVFGRQIRHKMSEGFPLLTTKKMAWKTMVTELLWFLRGDTNIKYLVDNNCHIWDGDAFKYYTKKVNEIIDGYKCGDIMGMQDHIEKLFSDSDKLTPLTIDEFINKIKTDDEFAKEWGSLGPVYGKQWRSWGKKNIVNYDLENLKSSDQVKVMDLIRDGGDYSKYDVKVTYQNNSIDQIQNLINDLKTNPDSRRLMVSAWNVGELDQMVLPPCHYGFQVYTRELSLEERNKSMGKDYAYRGVFSGPIANQKELDKYKELFDEQNRPTRAISLMWNQRSCDVPLGIPMNISSYGLLLMMIADEVNMVPEELIGNLGDCHIYLNQMAGVKEQIGREPFELPTVHVRDGIHCSSVNDVILENYQSHPKIYFPLSN